MQPNQLFMLLWTLLVILVPGSEEADELTLHVPSSVFEGDDLFLNCQGKSDWKLKAITYYKNKKKLFSSEQASSFIKNVVLSNSGEYSCTATLKKNFFWSEEKTSKTVKITVRELFPHPVLKASSFRPTEGRPVTLTCETQLLPQRSYVHLQFCFFRNGQALGSAWSSIPKLHIPAVRIEDSGSYSCAARTVSQIIRKESSPSKIQVQRVPVTNVSLQTPSLGRQVIEGGKLILLCSVAEGTGNITFTWHRKDTEASLGKKTQHALWAELEIPVVEEADAGDYYCEASNGHDPIQSKVVQIFVKIPVSCPVLTLRGSKAQVVVGDMVELRCEALRGSPPILYQFYHGDVTLWNSSAPFGGGVSFNLSLTAEHSGNYSCEASNGPWAQHSEAVSLSILGPESPRRILDTVKVLGGLFGIFGFIGISLLFYRLSYRMAGKTSAGNASRSANSLSPQESVHSSPLPAIEEQQPVYDNVNVHPEGMDVIYSQVWSNQRPERAVNSRRPFLENTDYQVIYTPLKC